MKRLLACTGLLAASPLIFALNCQNLGITIVNNTHQDCQLRNKTVFYGFFDQGTVPLNIARGATSDVFFMKQDAIGTGVQLGYQCGDKRIKFYSYQEHCFLSAGTVGGAPDVWNELDLVAYAKNGSYWGSLPGQITWNILD